MMNTKSLIDCISVTGQRETALGVSLGTAMAS